VPHKKEYALSFLSSLSIVIYLSISPSLDRPINRIIIYLPTYLSIYLSHVLETKSNHL